MAAAVLFLKEEEGVVRWYIVEIIACRSGVEVGFWTSARVLGGGRRWGEDWEFGDDEEGEDDDAGT